MAKLLASVDTDVIALLLSSDRSLTKEDLQRRTFAEQHMTDLRKQGVRPIIAAPVLAELTAKRPGIPVLEEIARVVGAVRVATLNADAAMVAGEILAKMLPQRAAGSDRVRVKFDCLIAAVSHHVGARYLVTGNIKDMAAALSAISSGTMALDATSAPVGQLSFAMPQPKD